MNNISSVTAADLNAFESQAGLDLTLTAQNAAATCSATASPDAAPLLSERENAAARRVSQMQPLTINNCFGWLHYNREDTASDVAVLICPAINRDALDAHHSLRLLADAFVKAGYPAMRFDYPDTGDSCDLTGNEQGTAEHWAAWQQTVHDAADLLLELTGASRLIICGLRIGTALAVLAAERRNDVAGLILLAPVARGQSYMRQLWIQSQLEHPEVAPMKEGLKLHEINFSPETIGSISQFDMRKAKLPAGLQVVIFSQAVSNLLTDCARIWRDQGAIVNTAGFQGLEPLLMHVLDRSPPPPDFSSILDWIKLAAPRGSLAVLQCPTLSDAVLRPSGCVETPMRFGPDKRLFGILCRPETQRGNMVVIMVNGGRDPHYGLGRFSVYFARHLAANGIASLRMDFAGMGDSIGPDGEEDVLSELLDTPHTSDITAAIDALEHCGYSEFAIYGICSGAYHALHGTLEEHRLGALLLVNMPLFTWEKGDSVNVARYRTFKTTHYLQKFFEQKAWSRLLTGDIDVAAFFIAQGIRLRKLFKRNGAKNFPQLAMESLSHRGVKTLFLFAPEDVGLDAVEASFGHNGAGLNAYGGIEIKVVPEFTHMLSSGTTRRLGSEMMTDFLVTSSLQPDQALP